LTIASWRGEHLKLAAIMEAARLRACSHGGSHTILSHPALASLIPTFDNGVLRLLIMPCSDDSRGSLFVVDHDGRQ
ncbi:hypothetical protein Tco_1322165, partial [Tanacetum coccineum]